MRKHRVPFEDFDGKYGILKQILCFSTAEGKELSVNIYLQNNEMDFTISINGHVKACQISRLKDALQVYNHS